jgi:hypothetical protein
MFIGLLFVKRDAPFRRTAYIPSNKYIS